MLTVSLEPRERLEITEPRERLESPDLLDPPEPLDLRLVNPHSTTSQYYILEPHDSTT